MTLKEQDIFNSVFFDENLIDSEIKEINNVDSFVSMLDFYDNLKNEIESNIENEERDKLISSVAEYKLDHVELCDSNY